MQASVTRRRALGLAAAGLGALVAACGGATSPTAAPAKPTEAPKAAAPAATTAPAAATKPAAAGSAPSAATKPAAAATSAPASAAKPTVAASAPQSSGPRAVTFMSTGNEGEQKMFQEALAAIKPKLDAQKITITWNPDPGGGWNKIMSMFAAGTAFDIQRIDDDRVYLLAVENKVHQLDRFMADSKLNKNDYFPNFFTTLAIEGYQYAMNPAGGANVVYYNQDLFEKAGVKAPTSWKEAWSWDDAWANFRKLARKGSGGKPEVYALGFPANISTPTGYGNGAQAFNADQTKCGFDGPDVLEVIDPIVQATVKEQLFPTPDLNLTELFNAGKLAMMWASMGVDRNFSKQIKWEVMPWFKTKKRAMTENYDRTFTIAKSAKDAEAAFAGLKALCEREAEDVFARGRFGMPYLKAAAEGPVFNDPSKPPKNKNVWFETFDVIDGQSVDVPTPRGPIGEAWKEAFTSELFRGALSGQMATKDFLDQASKRVNDTIAKWEWKKGKGLELLQKGGNFDPNARFYNG